MKGKKEIQEKIDLFEKGINDCMHDIVYRDEMTNGNPPGMPDAVEMNIQECERRIAYYIPAIKELCWVIGVDYKKDRMYYEILHTIRRYPEGVSLQGLSFRHGIRMESLTKMISGMVRPGS